MQTRALAIGAAAWTCGYLAIYLMIMEQQGDSPAWWYVGVLTIAVALLIPAVAGRPYAAALGLGAFLLTGAAALGLLSIGLLLVPAAAAAAVACVTSRRSGPAADYRGANPAGR